MLVKDLPKVWVLETYQVSESGWPSEGTGAA
jgi:hypothetical protein